MIIFFMSCKYYSILLPLCYKNISEDKQKRKFKICFLFKWCEEVVNIIILIHKKKILNVNNGKENNTKGKEQMNKKIIYKRNWCSKQYLVGILIYEGNIAWRCDVNYTRTHRVPAIEIYWKFFFRVYGFFCCLFCLPQNY